ncbi:MAG: WecB/TagA/CpsF family glycosyltransferase, partial [Defluviitaleaceae bacterium]|nr:WecB/TagA/CpsF family glycosyltransferase [Defluviitaleaceae bacterium]
GVAEKAKENMEARYSNFKVIGYHNGFFTAEEEAAIISEINHLSPDILLVCLGMPRAEIWATKNRNINARVTMCLGGTIDIMAGTVKLAPPLMRKLGLEWLNRLYRQPQRFFRMLDIPRFMWAVFLKRLMG